MKGLSKEEIREFNDQLRLTLSGMGIVTKGEIDAAEIAGNKVSSNRLWFTTGLFLTAFGDITMDIFKSKKLLDLSNDAAALTLACKQIHMMLTSDHELVNDWTNDVPMDDDYYDRFVTVLGGTAHDSMNLFRRVVDIMDGMSHEDQSSDEITMILHKITMLSALIAKYEGKLEEAFGILEDSNDIDDELNEILKTFNIKRSDS
jgi:hypothetical protein